jgi:beta-phosphoglucomutase
MRGEMIEGQGASVGSVNLLLKHGTLRYDADLIKYVHMSALIFDMDGVLADNSDFHVLAWTEYARSFGRELTVDEIKRRLGFNNREYMRFLLGREPTDEEVERSTVEKEALYRKIFAPHLAAPSGLAALLEFARRWDIVCGVATSAPAENVSFVLDGLNIRHYFKEVVDATHVKKCKPDPEIYRLAASRLGRDPGRCLVFEDAIAGIQSAKAAGMPVIALTSSYPAEVLAEHGPSAIIQSFEDLRKPCAASGLLEQLTGHKFTMRFNKVELQKVKGFRVQGSDSSGRCNEETAPRIEGAGILTLSRPGDLF